MNIFISHSWKYDKDYQTLQSWIDEDNRINNRNYSISSNNPLERNVWCGIENRIMQSSVVIIPLGIYASFSDSIQREIKIAKKYNKYIIAVILFGAERISNIVDEIYSDSMYLVRKIHWQRESVINALKEIKRRLL
ncbi:MAG: TIR domain-containing protein [Campylobacter sp.]|nr:TIR domain-containing protein [Campylobacter sp.]